MYTVAQVNSFIYVSYKLRRSDFIPFFLVVPVEKKALL